MIFFSQYFSALFMSVYMTCCFAGKNAVISQLWGDVE